jgi:hypothetical protein
MRREKPWAPVSHNFHYFHGVFTRTQLSLFSWSVYKNVVICSDGIQEDYIAKLKPPGDGPPLRSPTWPPSRNLDHNSAGLLGPLRANPWCPGYIMLAII